MPLSTPIQNLPTAAQAATAAPPEDPEVLRIIEDMEKEMAAPATPPASPPPPPPPAAAPPPLSATSPTRKLAPAPPPPLWSWNPENAQLAGLAAVAALVLFYPKTLGALYDRLPERYQLLVRPYDLLVRTALLALVLYVLLWKFKTPAAP